MGPSLRACDARFGDREFGIEWNRDLPSGEPALGYDVKITANLALVQA